MKYCFFFFAFVIAANAKAQTNIHADSLTLYHHNFNHNYTFLESQKTDWPQQNNVVINSDNSVMKLPAPKLTYVTNSNGFDIYHATPDNMFIAKPDDTIAFNIPVAGKAAK
jgi:hypothetical protein